MVTSFYSVKKYYFLVNLVLKKYIGHLFIFDVIKFTINGCLSDKYLLNDFTVKFIAFSSLFISNVCEDLLKIDSTLFSS